MPSTATDRIDGLTTSVAVKAPVRAATTANISLTGLQTVDGIALATGDRILVKDQSIGADNGIYVVGTTRWMRSRDFDGARDAVTGTLVYVRDGDDNADSYYRLTTSEPVRIGTSVISFTSAVLAGEAVAQAQAFAQQAEEAAELAQLYGGNTQPYPVKTANYTVNLDTDPGREIPFYSTGNLSVTLPIPDADDLGKIFLFANLGTGRLSLNAAVGTQYLHPLLYYRTPANSRGSKCAAQVSYLDASGTLGWLLTGDLAA